MGPWSHIPNGQPYQGETQISERNSNLIENQILSQKSSQETRPNVYRCGRGQDSQDSDDWQHDLSFMHLNIQMIDHVY